MRKPKNQSINIKSYFSYCIFSFSFVVFNNNNNLQRNLVISSRFQNIGFLTVLGPLNGLLIVRN